MQNPIEAERLEQSTEHMQRRRHDHISTLPIGYAETSQRQVEQIPALNASATVKLSKVYALVDAYSKLREPFVACKAGCDACCHMNVQITSLEANRIEKATGRKANVLQRDTFHTNERYAGLPCPFLVNHTCSIYEDRPLMCRAHASFDDDAYWCDPGRMNSVTLPMVTLPPATNAVIEIASKTPNMRMADIREFFSV